MTSIARNGDGTYALSFDGHPSVAADLVILSLPFAVLRKIDTSGAGFDARKNTAIQELGRGQNGKLQLQFTSRYWREPGPWPGRGNGLSYTDEGYQSTWEVSRRQFGASGLLNNYTGGSATAAKTTKTPFATAADADVQQDANAFLGGLESVFPGGTAKWNARAASSLPALDPNMGASYPYWRVGQYTSFAGYEKVRQGAIFFAGEHCSADYQGLMEGGAAEGARAAKEILDQLRVGDHSGRIKLKSALAWRDSRLSPNSRASRLTGPLATTHREPTSSRIKPSPREESNAQHRSRTLSAQSESAPRLPPSRLSRARRPPTATSMSSPNWSRSPTRRTTCANCWSTSSPERGRSPAASITRCSKTGSNPAASSRSRPGPIRPRSTPI